jgi:DNA-directed RNA polymerase subunit H (RpoH/RPB5)
LAKQIIENHVLIPKHTKLSQKAKDDLLKQYNLHEQQLPKILSTDPAIAKLAAKAGDVIKIVRKTRTSGISEFYRVVINA